MRLISLLTLFVSISSIAGVQENTHSLQLNIPKTLHNDSFAEHIDFTFSALLKAFGLGEGSTKIKREKGLQKYTLTFNLDEKPQNPQQPILLNGPDSSLNREEAQILQQLTENFLRKIITSNPALIFRAHLTQTGNSYQLALAPSSKVQKIIDEEAKITILNFSIAHSISEPLCQKVKAAATAVAESIGWPFIEQEFSCNENTVKLGYKHSSTTSSAFKYLVDIEEESDMFFIQDFVASIFENLSIDEPFYFTGSEQWSFKDLFSCFFQTRLKWHYHLFLERKCSL